MKEINAENFLSTPGLPVHFLPSEVAITCFTGGKTEAGPGKYSEIKFYNSQPEGGCRQENL